MAYIISESCLGCGSCIITCPNNAISPRDNIYSIDPAKCSQCVGAFETPRCAEICPIGVPILDPEHVESWELLLAKYQLMHSATS